MVGLLLSEVLFGRIMFLGMRAGLDCRLMGWFGIVYYYLL
jgi:hypothetical protein